MNRLPAYRHCVNGRTFRATWRPGDYDPIVHYKSATSGWASAAVVAAAVVGLAVLALTLVGVL